MPDRISPAQVSDRLRHLNIFVRCHCVSGRMPGQTPNLVGGIPIPLKNMSSSIGMIIPNLWENNSVMFQSPPTRYIIHRLTIIYLYINHRLSIDFPYHFNPIRSITRDIYPLIPDQWSPPQLQDGAGAAAAFADGLGRPSRPRLGLGTWDPCSCAALLHPYIYI